MPKKLGKSASSLFRKTEPDQAPPLKHAIQPNADNKESSVSFEHQADAEFEEATEKVTFLLTPTQTYFLDELCLKIKRETGYDLARTEIIRALVRVLMEQDVARAVSTPLRTLKQREKSSRAAMLTGEVEHILIGAITECLQRVKKE